MRRLKPIYTLLLLFLTVSLWAAWKGGPPPTASAQAAQRTVYLEDFKNGSFPPALSADFNHSFSHGTAWDLAGGALDDPPAPSHPFALGLYVDNEDTVTFNLSGRQYVEEAQVWGYALPTTNDIPRGRGRVVFEGTGDRKTVTFAGGPQQWRLFSAHMQDTGDSGALLGRIVAVRLARTSAEGGKVYFDDLQITAVTPPTTADLDVSQTGPAAAVNIGDPVTYHLTVTNNGPDATGGVAVANDLPYGVRFDPGRSHASCRESGGVALCNLGTMANGDQRTLQIGGVVEPGACATLRNVVTVTANALDPDSANNTAVHTTTTPNPACADLALTQSAVSIPVEPGDNYAYVLQVTNQGPDATSGTTITVNLPPEVTFAYAGSSGSCTPAGNTVTCDLGALDLATTAWADITVTAPDPFSGILSSTATAASALDDPDTADNNTTFRFAVGPSYDYTLIAEAGVDQLASYNYAERTSLNNNGVVAFYAYDDFSELDHYGIYYGDGGPLTEVTVDTDFPAVPEDQYRRLGNFGFADINDANTVVWLHELLQREDPGSKLLEATIFTGNGGPPTTVATDSRADGGVFFRRYEQVAINNQGTVLAAYTIPYTGQFDGIVSFSNGVETTIDQTASGKFSYLNGVGLNDAGYFAYVEDPVLGRSITSTLYLKRPGRSPTAVTRSTSIYDSFSVSRLISVNNSGVVPLVKKEMDPLTGQGAQRLHVGQSTPVVVSALQGLDSALYNPRINDAGRIAFQARQTGFGRPGIFTGPHPVGHKVVAYDFLKRDVLFGSAVEYASLGDLNNAGQMAFDAKLLDGRRLVVRADPVFDNDLDGVTDYLENGAANGGDGNGDGVLDMVQLNVTSLPNQANGRFVTFATEPHYTLANVAAIANPSPGDTPPDAEFPLGHFSFEIHDLQPGASTTVTLYPPPGAAVSSYWKYGPTPANPTPHWYEFDYDSASGTGAQILPGRVVLHFVDGGRGDSDLTANGIIVDPGAPGAFPFAIYLPGIPYQP